MRRLLLLLCICVTAGAAGCVGGCHALGGGGGEAVGGGRVWGRGAGGTLSNSLSGLVTSLNLNILNLRGGWAPNRDAFEFAHAFEFAQAPPDQRVWGTSRKRAGGEGFETRSFRNALETRSFRSRSFSFRSRSFPQRSTANTFLLRLRGGWAPSRDPFEFARAFEFAQAPPDLRLRGGWAPNRDPRVWGRASLQGHGKSRYSKLKASYVSSV
jgi:hypothetical protein